MNMLSGRNLYTLCAAHAGMASFFGMFLLRQVPWLMLSPKGIKAYEESELARLVFQLFFLIVAAISTMYYFTSRDHKRQTAAIYTGIVGKCLVGLWFVQAYFQGYLNLNGLLMGLSDPLLAFFFYKDLTSPARMAAKEK
eukprot:GILK01003188.1.p1 GENE.GILK01003188.1~~GILK01003188.1.p1  ORF type:complete len:139 (-),score=16.19 GILK01003188.1:97-513(-)